MRFSKFLITTTKEHPKDATLKSHQYLVRGGFVNQVSAGIYNFLPLGKMVLDNIKAVIKEKLDNANAQEVSLGFVTPSEMWIKSKRFEKYGKELLRFKDRKENDFVLGPTHEEMKVEMVKNRVTSYKQLPINVYQINLKFRDEARPRFGLLRCKEFLMKDGYSFHSSEDDMKREFHLMETTYKDIFKTLGVDFRVVEADSGAIGGTGSKEFMVLADSGEDTIVICSSCEYAANIEAASRKKPICHDSEPNLEFQEIYTPNVKTIDELSKLFNTNSYYLLKAVAKRAVYDNHDEIVIFFIRGSDELQETKATNSVDANLLIDVSEDELLQEGVIAGFIGPNGLKCKTVFDSDLKDAKNLYCGANKKDYHFSGFNIDSLEDVVFKDLVEVKEGDKCSCCGSNLKYTKGIEVGHIFQLGTRYSLPLEANFLDHNGKSHPFVMGTYGIGVSRLVAAVVEQHHDEKGIIWTKAITPFLVTIIVSNTKDTEQNSFAEFLYEHLKSLKVPVCLDDRADRFGSKMADFELIGIPFAIVIGKKLSENSVEIVKRADLSKIEVAKNSVIDTIMELIA
ncbi:MAG: proline--tRNA ligase [Campylobacterales bacterium]|nr:proline--tRNA ligase [Campylobacterales bacterium]